MISARLFRDLAVFILFTALVAVGVEGAGSPSPPPKSGENNGCSLVGRALGLKGFAREEIPSKMISGEHLHVCSRGFTCCTQDMETKLLLRSRSDINGFLLERLSPVGHLLKNYTTAFNAYFLDVLNASNAGLHDMFVRTYGILYQQNSAIFVQLFVDLRSYYNGTDRDLADSVDRFFASLMRRMFVLLNDQTVTLTEDFLDCITTGMDRLRPFGDVPTKLTTQIKRAFVAARTFVQGLNVAREVVDILSGVEQSSSCVSAWMRMTYCPYCRGLTTHVGPCRNYCLNVLRGCLALHADIDHVWKPFIDELMRLAHKVKGPFNLEAVIGPMDVKISEAIMNFQDAAEPITMKVATLLFLH